MSFGKTKLLFSFALFGFLVGSAAYYVFDWLLMNAAFRLPLLEIITAPWCMSGIAGSAMAIIVVYASAHFSKDA